MTFSHRANMTCGSPSIDHLHRRWVHSDWIDHRTASCEVFGKFQNSLQTLSRSRTGIVHPQLHTPPSSNTWRMRRLDIPCWAVLDMASGSTVPAACMDSSREIVRDTLPTFGFLLDDDADVPEPEDPLPLSSSLCSDEVLISNDFRFIQLHGSQHKSPQKWTYVIIGSKHPWFWTCIISTQSWSIWLTHIIPGPIRVHTAQQRHEVCGAVVKVMCTDMFKDYQSWSMMIFMRINNDVFVTNYQQPNGESIWMLILVASCCSNSLSLFCSIGSFHWQAKARQQGTGVNTMEFHQKQSMKYITGMIWRVHFFHIWRKTKVCLKAQVANHLFELIYLQTFDGEVTLNAAQIATHIARTCIAFPAKAWSSLDILYWPKFENRFWC